MNKFTVSFFAAALMLGAAPALAADLPTGVVAAPPPPASTSNTIGFEFDPEFAAIASGSTAQGSLADWYAKGTFSHSFGNGFSAALAAQDTFKTNGLSQYYFEGSAAYKASLTKEFSVTITGLLGYTTGNTGYVGGLASSSTDNNDSYLYYAISGAADWKLDSHWTWNIINARYRNAFDRTWLTPKVTTGVTYNIDATNAVYATIGYSWKDNGNGKGLLGDKIVFGAGYKYSF